MSDIRGFTVTVRIGLTCYAVVHLLLAWLAAQVALGDYERTDKAGALQLVADGGGVWVLWLIVAGTGVLALWQLAEAIAGHRHAPARRRWVRRTVSGIEVVLYGLVAYSAAKTAAGGSGKAGSIVAAALGEPWGAGAVVFAGGVVIAVSAFLAYRGVGRKFVHDLDFGGASPGVRSLTERLGQVGWCAVALAYGTVGTMFVLAALRYDPGKAAGLDPALKTLAVQPYGPFLLLALAAGLAVFGVFALLEARFRRV
ncbi:DUF1206 domain-containing protein [Amycolatopsis sp. NPDC051045]|uniref:DUF1206 domain-containing protein n=1 Tax=Amycolatopsis sp. NPDC051045 TaxID=3156922 RepID=UPI00343A7391